MDYTIKTILCKLRGQSFSKYSTQRVFLPTHNVHVSPHDGRSNNSRNLRRSTSLVSAQNPSTSPTISPSDSTPTTTPAPTSTFLSQIQIENFALVDNQSITLHPGLNVITGESGSGKSVFIEAINQLLGAQSDTTMIRSPSPSCTIQGTLSIATKDLPVLVSLLQDTLQLPPKAITSLTTTNSLIIQREVSIIASRNNNNNGKKKNKKGEVGKVRSKCTINGASVSLKSVREVSKYLIDMNGQNSSLSMRESSHQLATLDTMVGNDSSSNSSDDLLGEFRNAWKDLQETRGQLIAFQALGDEEERLHLQEMADQVFRLVGCMAGEDRLLRRQMKKLDSQRSSSERCQMATVSLGEGGVSDALVTVEQSIRSVLIDQHRVDAALEETNGRTDNNNNNGDKEDDANDDDDDDEEEEEDGRGQLEDILESLSQARESIRLAREGIKRYARTHRFSQQHYDEMSARLEQLTKLCKQYDAVDVDELIEKTAAIEAQLDAYYQMEGRREEIESNAEMRLKRAQQAAVALSKGRREAAQALGPAVTAMLGELAMGSAQFDVSLQWDKISDIYINQDDKEEDDYSNSSIRESIIKYGNALPIPADLAAQCGHAPGIYKIKQSKPLSSNSSSSSSSSGNNNSGSIVGLDTAEFLFAAGPDEPLKSLSSVASGGEAARIVLALKAAPSSVWYSSPSGSPPAAAALVAIRAPLSEQQPAITVLDEIDSSIGSRLGLVIGRILRRMAGGGGGGGGGNGQHHHHQQQQVICVSHLPQVAAHGQHHIVVRKGNGNGGGGGGGGKERLVTKFKALDTEQERLDEVAAMLGLHGDAARELMAQVE